MSHSISQFLAIHKAEGQRTLAMLKALPSSQYDFRPDTGGRSLGELAWHLAELELYIGVGVENGKMDFSAKIPGGERPKEISLLAPGYEQVHQATQLRLAKLTDGDLEKVISFLPGVDLPTHAILWDGLIFHQIHHRGQLSLMTRLASAVAPGIYGPNREESAAMRAKAK